MAASSTDLPVHYFRARDGLELAYREMGVGRTLILIHGYFSTAMVNWVRYGHAAKIAANGYRVVMPDLRGHGDSAKPHDIAFYPRDVLADDGLALVEHLELTDYDLGGYSLGARTTVRMLARGATGDRSAAEGIPRSAAGAPWEAQRRESHEAPQGRRGTTPKRALVAGMGLEGILHTEGRGGHFRNILTNLGKHKPGSAEWMAEAFMKTVGGDPVALLNVLNTFEDTPREALAHIDIPTLVLTGAEDDDNGSAEALSAALPKGRYVVVPGNHMSAVTKPELGAAMAAFLTA
jgi:pimeloyl-ACP methyl ester carboxylesterase